MGEFPLAAQVNFTNPDFSYRVFSALEANPDGWGGWKVVDTLGAPWIDLPEDLQEDLLTWRWLNDIARRIHAQQTQATNKERK